MNYGFPEENYHFEYPAHGSPILAKKVAALLQAAGIESQMNFTSGFDHGFFIPMLSINPQIYPSYKFPLSLDLAEHLRNGRVLAPLRDEGIVIGSGFITHDLSFRLSVVDSQAITEEVANVMKMNGEERDDGMINWDKLPAARKGHPREENLLPLDVALGVDGTQSIAQRLCQHLMPPHMLSF